MQDEYFGKIDRRFQLQSALESIRSVRQYSGVGENPPLTHPEDENLKDAYKLISKTLQTIKEG
jgi:hypothetical protein